MAEQQSPRIVIAARAALIKQIAQIGGRVTETGREAIADWLISSGNLADSFYDGVATDLDNAKASVDAPKVKRTDQAVQS